MLRLLEYERATVDAEGAIGLAALVAGKLPELKGKRYGSCCKQGTVAKHGVECLDRGKQREATCFTSDKAVPAPELAMGLSVVSTSDL